MTSLDSLILEIRKCRHCKADLPHGPRPILAAATNSRILIIGQAPGIRVHQSGVPWNDPSGNRLRQWLGIDETDFYDSDKVAIVPMGFCYPGTGKSGDRPPRPECAPLWHDRLLAELTNIQLTLLIGRYAQRYVLGEKNGKSLTETIQRWKNFRPELVPLPHPSPRNNRWLQSHAWFDQEVVPYLKRRVKQVLS